MRRRLTVNIAEEDPVALVKDLTDGYGADVYLEGTGHPSAVQQGLNAAAQARPFVEYGVFKEPVTVDWSIISDDKELDVLGAHLGPDCWPAAIRHDRVRAAAAGPTSAPTSCRWPSSRRGWTSSPRQGVGQGLAHPRRPTAKGDARCSDTGSGRPETGRVATCSRRRASPASGATRVPLAGGVRCGWCECGTRTAPARCPAPSTGRRPRGRRSGSCRRRTPTSSASSRC